MNDKKKKTCRNCSAFLAGDSVFCAECGRETVSPEPFITEAVSRFGDRLRPGVVLKDEEMEFLSENFRAVSFLFLQIGGYRAFSPTVVADDVSNLIRQFVSDCAEATLERAVFVVRTSPDSMVFVMGSAKERADGALEAVGCGLEIMESARSHNNGSDLSLEIRTGVAGIPLSEVMPHRKICDALKCAETIGKAAEPGRIWVCPETRLLIGNKFSCQKQEPIPVSDKEELISVYSVLGPLKGDVQSNGLVPNRTAPLVGRESEIGTIKRSADRVRKGTGSALRVIGKAGVGKSRLLLEAEQKHLHGFVRWKAICLPHASVISYYPFRELIRRQIHAGAGDGADTARKKLIDYLGRLGMETSDPTIDRLMGILGYALPTVESVSPSQWKRETSKTIIDLFAAVAAKQPVCLIVENMQWIDPSSKDLLLTVIKATTNLPVLVCLEERTDPGQSTESLKEKITDVPLGPLGFEETGVLVDYLVDSEAIASSFKSALRENEKRLPLYIECIARQLMAEEIAAERKRDGKGSVAPEQEFLPEDLMSLIGLRIAKLDESSRRILQAGAILGQAFTINLLEHMDVVREGLQEKLATLEGLGFLQRDAESDGPKYVFHHALVEELVYNSIREEHRRHLHSRFIECIFSTFGRESAPHYPIIAYHALKAGITDLALEYLDKTAEWARRQYAGREVIEYYGKMLALLARSPFSPETAGKMGRILVKQAHADQYLGETDEAEKDLQQARSVASEAGDDRLSAQVHLGFALLYARTGDYVGAVEACGRAGKILDTAPDPELEMQRHNIEAIAAWKQGDFRKAEPAFYEAINWAKKAEKPYYAANCYNNLGLIYGNMGRTDLSVDCHTRALEIRRETGDIMGQAASHNNVGIIYENTGDYNQAREHYAEALNLSVKTGYIEVETAVLANLGQLSEFEGRFAEALDYSARSLDLARRTDDLRSQAIALDNLGNAYGALRDFTAAETNYRASLEISRMIGDRDTVSRSLLGLCFIGVETGNHGAVEPRLAEAQALIEEMGLDEALPRLHRARAALSAATGRIDEAVIEIDAAILAAQESNQLREGKLAEKYRKEVLERKRT